MQPSGGMSKRSEENENNRTLVREETFAGQTAIEFSTFWEKIKRD